MPTLFEEAEGELRVLLERYANQPRKAVVKLLLLALEREEIVSMAYRESQIAERLQLLDVPEDVRRLIQHTVIWLWKDEEMHAVYACGALMRQGSLLLRVQALAQQTGGILAGWATSVLHHASWRRAPLARVLAHLITATGRLAGKVPGEVGKNLRSVSFRDFCLFNADLEKASWMAWDRLALLADSQQMLPSMIADFHQVAHDEIRHLRVFEVLAASLTPDDRLAPGQTASELAERIAEVSVHFLPYQYRWPQKKDSSASARSSHPIGSGDRVWSLQGLPDESTVTTFMRLLKDSCLADVIHDRASVLGKDVSQLRIVIKTSFMLGYHHNDPSPITDPALIRGLVQFLREHGCTALVVAENRNLYDFFFRHRSVREVAQYFGLEPDGFQLIDLSEEQEPHTFPRGMGQTTVSRSWRDADFRLSLGKVRSHPIERALLSLGNLEGIGGRTDQFLFAERQADRATALMMILDEFPPDFTFLDCYSNVPDGLAGMMGSKRPKQPRRIYGGRDPLAVDCVVARHLGLHDPGESPLLRAANHWFGGWPVATEIIGTNEPLDDWRGPYSTGWHTFLSLCATPVYIWGSGRGRLFVPLMDPIAFPEISSRGFSVCSGQSVLRWLLALNRNDCR